MATTAKRGGSRKPREAVMTAEDFRALLAKSGLTTREAGERLGVDHSTVSRWQTGDTPLTKRNTLLIRAVFEATDESIGTKS